MLLPTKWAPIEGRFHFDSNRKNPLINEKYSSMEKILLNRAFPTPSSMIQLSFNLVWDLSFNEKLFFENIIFSMMILIKFIKKLEHEPWSSTEAPSDHVHFVARQLLSRSLMWTKDICIEENTTFKAHYWKIILNKGRNSCPIIQGMTAWCISKIIVNFYKTCEVQISLSHVRRKRKGYKFEIWRMWH